MNTTDQIIKVPFLKKYSKIIVKSKIFNVFVLLLIFAQTIFFTLDNPLIDPHSKLTKTLNILERIITVFFIFEIFFKLCALGLYYSGPKSFFKNWFNIIDFFIVLISVTSLTLTNR